MVFKYTAKILRMEHYQIIRRLVLVVVVVVVLESGVLTMNFKMVFYVARKHNNILHNGHGRGWIGEHQDLRSNIVE